VVSKTRENDNEILILNKNGKLSQNWHKITLNKIAKYHKIGIQTLTNQDCKIAQNWHQEPN